MEASVGRRETDRRDRKGACDRFRDRHLRRADVIAQRQGKDTISSTSIRRLKSEGKTIIYISHFLDEIIELCDRFLRPQKWQGGRSRPGRGHDQERHHSYGGRPGCRCALQVHAPTRKTQAGPSRSSIMQERQPAERCQLPAFRRARFSEIWGLMGSGRTELVRAMLGLDRLDRGEILFAEEGKLRPIAPDRLLAALRAMSPRAGMPMVCSMPSPSGRTSRRPI